VSSALEVFLWRCAI